MDENESGNYLKKLRKINDLTLQDLGKQIGFSDGYISMVENGKKKKPSLEFLLNISNALGADFNNLLELTGNIDKDRLQDLIKLEKQSKALENKFMQNTAERDKINLEKKKKEHEIYSILNDYPSLKTNVVNEFTSPQKSKRKVNLSRWLRSENDLYYDEKLLTKKDRQDIIKFIENFIIKEDK